MPEEPVGQPNKLDREFALIPEEKIKDLESRLDEIEKIVDAPKPQTPEEFEKRLEDIEDLIMVEQAGVIELKNLLEGGAQVTAQLPPELGQRIANVEAKLAAIDMAMVDVKNIQNVLHNIPELREITDLKLDLENIRTSIEYLPGSLNNMKQRLTYLENTVPNLEENMRSMPEIKEVWKFRDDLDDLRQNIQRVTQLFPRFETKFNEMEEKVLRVDDMEEKIREMPEMKVIRSLKTGIENVHHTMEQIPDLLSTLEQRLSQMERLVPDIEGIQERVKATPELKRLNSLLVEIEPSLDMIRKVAQSITVFQSKLDQMDAVIPKIDMLRQDIIARGLPELNKIGEIKESFYSLQQSMQNFGVRMDSEIGRIRQDWTDYSQKIAKIETNFNDITDNLNTFRETITDVPELVVNTLQNMDAFKNFAEMKKNIEDKVGKSAEEIGRLKEEWTGNLTRIQNFERTVGQVSMDLAKFKSVFDDMPNIVVESIENLDGFKNFAEMKNDLDSKISNTNEELGKVRSEWVENINKIENIEKSIIDLSEGINQMKPALEKVEDVELTISVVRELQADVDRISSDTKDMKNELAAKINKIVSLENTLNQTVKEKDEIKESLSEIEANKLREIKDDWRANIERVSMIERVLNDFKSDMESVKPLVEKLRDMENVEDVKRSVIEKSNELRTLQANTNILMEKVYSMYRDMESKASAMENLEADMKEVGGKIDEFNQRHQGLDELHSSTLALKDMINDKLYNVNFFSKQAMTFFEKIVRDLKKAKGDFDANIDQKLNEAVNEVRNLHESTTGEIDKITSMAEDVAKQAARVEIFYDSVNERMDKYKKMEMDMSKSLENVSDLISEMDKVKADNNEARKKFNEMTTDVSHYESEIGKRVIEIEKRLDELRPENISIDMESAMGRLEDRLDEKVKDVKQSLYKKLSEIQKPIMDMQIKQIIEKVMELETRMGALEIMLRQNATISPIVLE